MKVKVFLAFQFGNAKLSKSEKEGALINAIKQCNKELKEESLDIEFYWENIKLTSGKNIAEQLFDKIKESGIFIADLSELNKNVLFELGIAYTFEKIMHQEVVWLIHDSVNFEELPSDIKGIFYDVYNNKDDLKAYLALTLKDRAKNLLSKKHIFDDIIIEDFWHFKSFNQVDILCSEIPTELLPYYANIKDRNYLRYAKFADLDTLIYLKSNISKISPKCNVRDFSPSEYFDTNTQQLFIIGGPPWNSKYKEIQKILPFYFEENELGKDDPLCFYENNTKLYPSWTKTDDIIYDISVYTRLLINNSLIIHMLGGCLTFGVLGAVKAFFYPKVAIDNISWLKEKIDFNKSFSVIFPTNVINSLSVPTNIKEAKFNYLFHQINDKMVLLK